MILNGKEFPISNLKTQTIQSLIDHLQLKSGTIAIELNGDIPEKKDWSSIQLKNSDKIEIIKFVGGG
jgi:sulfur carrier protein